MDYGVFTSECLEVAVTGHWALCFYRSEDAGVIGAKLYYGMDSGKQLIAVCERDIPESSTCYAYIGDDDQEITNDRDGICRQLGSALKVDFGRLKKIDSIIPSPPYEMPSVSERGVADCLKMWRMGATAMGNEDGIMFFMVTNKIEYVFRIIPKDCDIYCGASVNIPFDGGMFGQGQYFRLRNFRDNSQPFCKFYCNLGKDITISDVPDIQCESGKCTVVQQGILWPVKSYSDNEIVLDGCGGEEYRYNRFGEKDECFVCE